ncbi:MAG TPA: hypothetical protein PLC59_00055 [Bacteroidales bacterium]|jgi:hypothetical protein|nr:hypothetical protein [Bacteroidales bacterium]HQI44455.1 hypothetical protein [Bacteroidales bacterium]
MKAIEFPEANAIFAKNQSSYMQLPAYKSPDGIVTSCYKLTWKERLQILFGANIWVSLMTFNKPLQPQRLYVGKKIC